MLHAVEGAGVVFLLLRFCPRIRLGVLAQVVVGRDQKTAGACCGVLDDVFQFRFHHRDHAVDQHARGEVLACAGFLFVGVLFQQAFVKVAQAFLTGAVPIEFVDFAHQRGKRGRFFDEAAGVGEDFLHQFRAVAAQMDQQYLVELQPVWCGEIFQVVPAVFFGELIFGAGFLGHLEEQQIGQLGDVLVIGDAVVLEDVAQVPEFADDVVGGHRLSTFMN